MGLVKVWTKEVIDNRFKAGHGHGSRENYIPWKRIQDFSSTSPQSRVPSLLFDRRIHTFSLLERSMYIFLEFEGGILDYREQFPIDREVTKAAAARLKIRHPRYMISGEHVVMNIDALVSRADDWLEGWDAKPMRELTKKRVIEKLALHKAYCEHLSIPHYIFTEETVPPARLGNIDLCRKAIPRTGETLRPADLFSRHLPIVEETVCKPSRSTIGSFCNSYDRANNLRPGSTLRLIRCLVWTKRVLLDLNVEELHLTKLRSLRRAATGE